MLGFDASPNPASDQIPKAALNTPIFDLNSLSLEEEEDSIDWDFKSLSDILNNLELLGKDREIVVGLKL